MQPVPFASGLWQAGHQKQMTGISLAVAALLSGGRVQGTQVHVLCSAHGLNSARCPCPHLLNPGPLGTVIAAVCMGGLVCAEDSVTSLVMAWIAFWCSWHNCVTQPGQMLRAAVRHRTLCCFTILYSFPLSSNGQCLCSCSCSH